MIRSERHFDLCTPAPTDPSQTVAVRREADSVDPSITGTAVLGTERVERQTLTPRGRCRLLIQSLDVGRVNTGLHVGRAGGQENIVGMPFDTQHGGTDGLLQMLTHPPIIVLVKVADGNASGSTGHGKFVLLR
jgi:hypothetical protein